jgi:hypothetical protein
MARRVQASLTDTSPASAITAVGGDLGGGFRDCNALTVVATIQGGTGGVLDVYLQTSFDGGTTWLDYAHFPQLAAGAAATTRVWHVTRDSAVGTLIAVGSGTSPSLTVNTINGGAFGDTFRVVYVAGASTSAGAAQVVKLFGWG